MESLSISGVLLATLRPHIHASFFGDVFLSVYQFDILWVYREEFLCLVKIKADLHLKERDLQGKAMSDSSELFSGVLLSFVAG